MLTVEQLRILETLGLAGLYELKKVGGSYALFLPKVWVDLFCLEVDGSYWVQLTIGNDGTITFERPNMEKLEEDFKHVQVKVQDDKG